MYVKEDDRSKNFKIGDKVIPIQKTCTRYGIITLNEIKLRMEKQGKKYLEVTRIRDEKEEYIIKGELVIWCDTFDSGKGWVFYENDLIKIKKYEKRTLRNGY